MHTQPALVLLERPQAAAGLLTGEIAHPIAARRVPVLFAGCVMAKIPKVVADLIGRECVLRSAIANRQNQLLMQGECVRVTEAQTVVDRLGQRQLLLDVISRDGKTFAGLAASEVNF